MRAGPELVVVGAMTCGTTALHALLDRHPNLAMVAMKEVDFFDGEELGGRWHRGAQWYAELVGAGLLRR